MRARTDCRAASMAAVPGAPYPVVPFPIGTTSGGEAIPTSSGTAPTYEPFVASR